MVFANIRRILKFDYFMLALVLGLAFYIAFIPHQNYPYPVHVDEWVHLSFAKAIIHDGSVNFVDPFGGTSFVSISSNLEASFQLFWGVAQRLTGISWMTIFRYFPGIIFMITVLSVFIMAQREGFGWEAALFTCLIPTTVGTLGPAFLIPMAMGLLFTPLLIFLAFNFRGIRSYGLIFVIISFLLAIHAPSAIFPIAILTPYILLNLRRNFKHSLGLGLALTLPFLIVFPWIFSLLLLTAQGLLERQSPSDYVQLPHLIQSYGYLPVAFSLLGTFVLALKGGVKNYGLVLGLLAMLGILTAFFTFHYGVSILYERGLTFASLTASIVAGAGLAGIRNTISPARLMTWIKAPFVAQNAGRFLCLVLVGIVLAINIPRRLDTVYYKMIDQEDYAAFVWIEQNVGADYQKAIVDPWKATAFTAITGKSIYSRIHSAPMPTDITAYNFLATGSNDTNFLRANGISLIYTRVLDTSSGINTEHNSTNPDLVQIAPNIYVLKR